MRARTWSRGTYSSITEGASDMRAEPGTSCPAPLMGRNPIPQDAMDAAIAHPEAVAGWGELCNPGLPFHPLNNGYRTALNPQNPNLAYDPASNGLVFTCGCR